jgi:hypothetical protein
MNIQIYNESHKQIHLDIIGQKSQNVLKTRRLKTYRFCYCHHQQCTNSPQQLPLHGLLVGLESDPAAWVLTIPSIIPTLELKITGN